VPSVYWRRRLAVFAAVLVVAAGLGVGAYFLVDSLRTNDEPAAPAPKVVVKRQEPQAVEDLGFPAFATKNTTRVSGPDPVVDAAAVALAVFPSIGGVEGPPAVSLVQEADWPSGIAAASLMAAPVGAPILLTNTDGLPPLTSDALTALAPAGSAATDDKQLFRIGSATVPSGLRTEGVTGGNAAEIAAAVARLRERLTGKDPRHILLASSDKPTYAMPAAAWAARSGDPVLFLERKKAPKPTLEAIRAHKGVPVYVLGPASVISDKAVAQVKKVAGRVVRVGAADPVANSIAFARFVDGSFGWNINDPGHGFVIASYARPADAAAAAPLSASGNWGPLLVTTDPAQVLPTLRGYLLDVKPGYVDDPTRAVYNHIWLMGDEDAISVDFQAGVDDLAEVTQVRSGTGATPLGPPPGTPEPEKRKP
jgi:hypothetical protein